MGSTQLFGLFDRVMAHGGQLEIFAAEQVGGGEEKNDGAGAGKEQKRHGNEVNQDGELSRLDPFDQREREPSGFEQHPAERRREHLHERFDGRIDHCPDPFFRPRAAGIIQEPRSKRHRYCDTATAGTMKKILDMRGTRSMIDLVKLNTHARPCDV